MPCVTCLGLEAVTELVEWNITAFEMSPGVGVRIGGVDSADKAGWKAIFVFVAGKRLERAGEDDPTKIPQDGANGALLRMAAAGAHGPNPGMGARRNATLMLD